MTKEFYNLVSLPIKCKEVAAELRAIHQCMTDTDYTDALITTFIKQTADILEHNGDVMLDSLEDVVRAANI